MRYGNAPSRDVVYNPHNLPSSVGKDGKLYPYHIDDPAYLSKFPLGFKGYFKCGSTEHWSRNTCPLGGSTDRAIMEIFF